MTRRPDACRCTRLDRENKHGRGCPLFVPPLFTSGKTTRDPEPWVLRLSGGTKVRSPYQEYPDFTYDPRPEFDNHNPILVAFREDRTEPGILNWYLGALDDGAQVTHARRVLTKLANVYKEA